MVTWRRGGSRPDEAPARDEERVLRNPSRVAALRRAHLLDTQSEEMFDRLTRIASKVLDAPVALFTLVDADRQFCKSCVGLPDVWLSDRDSPLSYSFCQHAVAQGTPLVIRDARKHPLVRRDPATMRGVIAYAGVPLVTSDGHALGTLCVIDFQPRDWNEQEVQILSELAASVVSKIELRFMVREAEEKAREAERAKEALRESEERFRTAFDAAPIGMALVATDGRWIRVNQALCSIVGYARAELLASTHQEITFRQDRAPHRAKVEQLLSGEATSYEMEMRYVHKEGRLVWALLTVSLVHDQGRPFYFIAQVQDITLRKHEEDRLRTLSMLDDLSGLYNRRAFLTVAREQLKIARRQEYPLLLLFLDIDGMKEINDSRGHAAGDRAIVAVAEVLRSTFREADLLARLGGDEFAVLASDVDPEGTHALAARLRTQLRGKEWLGGEPLPLSMSIGEALFDPASREEIEALIERADASMYQDKARNGTADGDAAGPP